MKKYTMNPLKWKQTRPIDKDVQVHYALKG